MLGVTEGRFDGTCDKLGTVEGLLEGSLLGVTDGLLDGTCDRLGVKLGWELGAHESSTTLIVWVKVIPFVTPKSPTNVRTISCSATRHSQFCEQDRLQYISCGVAQVHE